jgi:micrococcal nuclease
MAFKCPDCKRIVPDKNDTCLKCGRKFTEEEIKELTKRSNRYALLVFIFIGVIVTTVCSFFFRGEEQKDLVSVYLVSNTLSIRKKMEKTFSTTQYNLAGIKIPKFGSGRYSKDEPLAKETQNFIEKTIGYKSFESNGIYLEVASKHGWDNYAYIWLDVPTDSADVTIRSLMLNALLLSNGYAKFDPKAINDNVEIAQPYMTVFEELQKEAQIAKIGIWGLPENSPEALKKKAEIEKQEAETERKVRAERARRRNIVVITPTGSKYHRPSCRTVRDSYRELTINRALSSGYEPCRVCSPPKQEVKVEESFPVYGD